MTSRRGFLGALTAGLGLGAVARKAEPEFRAVRFDYADSLGRKWSFRPAKDLREMSINDVRIHFED